MRRDFTEEWRPLLAGERVREGKKKIVYFSL